MRILLDTHILLWWLADDRRLPNSVRSALGDPAHDIYVSAVSRAEISIKLSLGKLAVRGDLAGALAESGLETLSFTFEHASRLELLPWHHRDPFDRMLISQAMAERLVFASVDPAGADYEIEILR